MKLERKASIVSLVSLLLLIFAVLGYRWTLQNAEVVDSGQRLIESNQRELRNLRNTVSEFNGIATHLNSDGRLEKLFIDKPFSFYAEFGREGVENIDDVLNFTYQKNGFFQLKRLSIKHHNNDPESDQDGMSLLIEGSKLLESP